MDKFIALIADFKQDLLQILQQNSIMAYVGAIGAIVLGCFAVVVIKKIMSSISKRPYFAHHPRLQVKTVRIVRQRLVSLLFVVPFYWAFSSLVIPAGLERALEIFFVCLFLFTGIKFLSAAIALLIDFWLRSSRSKVDPATGKAVMPIARTVLWALALTFLLDNLGFQVSTIIAGLGIMGVAVGLAGQAILSDFFSYLVILIDKPFKIGDYVMLNASGITGNIERIGLKTTRLRSTTGERIVCSNTEITRGILSNYDDIEKRRARLLFPLPFDITPGKIEAITQKMKDTIAEYKECAFVRAVLVDFGPFAMNFELLYTVSLADANKALGVQHEINLKLLAYLESEGITLTGGNPTNAPAKSGR